MGQPRMPASSEGQLTGDITNMYKGVFVEVDVQTSGL
jgi:hypothetical protein